MEEGLVEVKVGKAVWDGAVETFWFEVFDRWAIIPGFLRQSCAWHAVGDFPRQPDRVSKFSAARHVPVPEVIAGKEAAEESGAESFHFSQGRAIADLAAVICCHLAEVFCTSLMESFLLSHRQFHGQRMLEHTCQCFVQQHNYVISNMMRIN